MNIIPSLLIAVVYIASIQPAAQDCIYRIAQEDDVPGILAQYEKASEHDDAKKIVILPQAFREPALKTSLISQRMYVAQKDGTIVGFKKLFLLTNPLERHEVLADEIRCFVPSICASIVARANLQEASATECQALDAANKVILYNGGDFTDPLYRQQGINVNLMRAALKHIKPAVLDELAQPHIKGLVMVFGLTQANAGKHILDGRTSGILRAFNTFINELSTDTGLQFADTIALSRHAAFMPTFDPLAMECKPLPDDQAIAGFGSIIECALLRKAAQ